MAEYLAGDVTMPSNQDNNADNYEFLNEIVRMGRNENRDDFTRPSRMAIEAYLTGRATSAQKQEVTAALLNSAHFRREILELAGDVASLSDRNLAREFETADVSDVPDLGAFLNQFDHGTDSGIAARDRKTSLLHRIGLLFRSDRGPSPAFRPSRFRYAMVGLGLLSTFIIFYVGNFSDDFEKINTRLALVEWDRVSKMDAGLFVENITRATDAPPPEEVYFTSHRDAAEAEFVRLINSETGEYLLDTTGMKTESTEVSHSVALYLIGKSGHAIGKFSADFPLPVEDGSSGIKAWVLALPSRILYSRAISSASNVSVWAPANDSIGCVIFTHEFKGNYFAVFGGIFYLR
jgi:hypothetical protein